MSFSARILKAGHEARSRREKRSHGVRLHLTKKAQIKGRANKAAGSVKKAAGKATKDRSLRAKGTAQKAKGTVQDTSGKVASKMEGMR
jgi:uncharacterized protein YjbJ (UPF0337 family)